MNGNLEMHKRKEQTRSLRETILILCEGEKTEPNYFKDFPVNAGVVEVKISGIGYNTDSLVKKAIQLKERAERQGTPYNQVWCVFDRDEFPLKDFNNALLLAQNNKIKVAYSNECFELWYDLHFNYTQTAFHRKDYIKRLGKFLNCPYIKNMPGLYGKLKKQQSVAIRNAKKLLSHTQKYGNPSTTVHLLVEELTKFIDEKRKTDES